MLDFPKVPKWWEKGIKFMRLEKGFSRPDWIVGYDTETFKGSAMTQQFYDGKDGKLFWSNDANILSQFLSYCERKYYGYVIVYCFNAKFDLSLLLRKYIDRFMSDQFAVNESGWEINVFCSKNWYASFQKGSIFIRFLDIANYFYGSLDTVSKSFSLDIKKMERPDGLGSVRYSKSDKKFYDYAMMDAILCQEMGERIIDMHSEFDIPISSSSANFAEKVFRRMFIKEGMKIQFPSWEAKRLAEIAYHGGKNGYYLDGPRLVHNVYEYDFNAAYGFAMYSLPSFVSGNWRKVKKFHDGKAGVYQIEGEIESCKYGILYDSRFNYFTFPQRQIVRSFCTSYEIEEALRSKELQIKSARGWIWEPDTEENPLKEYSKYFWEKKNTTPKGDVRYLFYKLCLNSLYGKWIQRNPGDSKLVLRAGQLELFKGRDVSGGLYNPFIAALITGFTRARLHRAEHLFSAIESSTDSVKSQIYRPEHDKGKGFGVMQLENLHCVKCGKIKKLDGLFVRNRLNLLMDKKGHILKCALHGFWGKKEELKKIWLHRNGENPNEYQVERMPLIREGLTQQGKTLFTMISETRMLNIDWSQYEEVK
jgi:hypothetical protein